MKKLIIYFILTFLLTLLSAINLYINVSGSTFTMPSDNNSSQENNKYHQYNIENKYTKSINKYNIHDNNITNKKNNLGDNIKNKSGNNKPDTNNIKQNIQNNNTPVPYSTTNNTNYNKNSNGFDKNKTNKKTGKNKTNNKINNNKTNNKNINSNNSNNNNSISKKPVSNITSGNNNINNIPPNPYSLKWANFLTYGSTQSIISSLLVKNSTIFLLSPEDSVPFCPESPNTNTAHIIINTNKINLFTFIIKILILFYT